MSFLPVFAQVVDESLQTDIAVQRSDDAEYEIRFADIENFIEIFERCLRAQVNFLESELGLTERLSMATNNLWRIKLEMKCS